jgi:glycosyltransferase involved in cell wall biosynthesis
MIEAVHHLRRDGQKIVLEFLGSGPKDLGRNPKLQTLISQSPPGALRFHGWLPNEKALTIAASADFGILLRNRARWSDACFPSKVAEFQALGIPMLCNLTSDLDQALKDGDNALVVPDVSVAGMVTTLKRALALTPVEKQRLKHSSLLCAEKYFDYRSHIDRVAGFMRGLSGNAGSRGILPQ